MKTFLTTLAAVLLAALLLFAWHRWIVLWESDATASAAILERLVETSKSARLDLDSPRNVWATPGTDSDAIDSAAALLRRAPPLADKSLLSRALSRAESDRAWAREQNWPTLAQVRATAP